MSDLLGLDPFGERQDQTLLNEMNALTRHHLAGCAPYARLWPRWNGASSLESLPFLHVGIFKRVVLKTSGDGIRHQRTLTSSSTTGSSPSRVSLDDRSSALQADSVKAIHRAWIGDQTRPLLICDSADSLRQRGTLSARLAAALSLQSVASETQFILQDGERPESVRWDVVSDVLRRNKEVIIYGLTWGLWQGWADKQVPSEAARLLRETRIDFAHSGGWKKLEAIQVDRKTFESRLLSLSGSNSRVVDYYGLTEQVGMLFPLCHYGRRHAPVWAEIIVRDIYTLQPVIGQPGLLQLMNPLAWGAPYHSVLTEDSGRRFAGNCPCGRKGRHFELLGRLPRAEVRGCANV